MDKVLHKILRRNYVLVKGKGDRRKAIKANPTKEIVHAK